MDPMKRLAPAVCALLLTAVLASCGGPPAPPSQRPDVVLITVDALRHDHLGVYGYGRGTSPAVDRFAAGALVVETAIAQAGYTVPSVSAILTGKLPIFAGMKHEPKPLDASNETLAEVLADAGYDTAGFVDNGLLNRLAGWDQGFAEFVCMDKDEAAEVTRLALEWLDRPHDRPIFLWVHVLDPHAPYKDRPAYYARYREASDTRTWIKSGEVDDDAVKWDAAGTRNAINLYDGEIAYMDDHVGRVLDRLAARPRAARTLVIFSADHGEAFMEHNHKSHGYDCFDENIRVPLIVRPPTASPAGKRLDALVRLIDLFPTVLDYAGLPPRTVQGQSLRPLFDGRPGWTERPALSQDSGGDFAVRDRRMKIIRREKTHDEVWFDLVDDPKELLPQPWSAVPSALSFEADNLLDVLDAYARAWGTDKGRSANALDPQTRAALESLGYVRRAEPAPPPSPAAGGDACGR
jgi:arylsulfatase